MNQNELKPTPPTQSPVSGDTPRADAAVIPPAPEHPANCKVFADFARTLERENQSLQDQLKEALDANQRANQLIGAQAQENDKLHSSTKQLVEKLVEALNKTHLHYDICDNLVCAFCNHQPKDGHASHCVVGKALTLAKEACCGEKEENAEHPLDREPIAPGDYRYYQHPDSGK